ncbi:MAG: hypothetical protein H6510_13915 [Acidobacteria bacterium]|nr:hypothetical protein [Acidobacteriota bacterium]MCB9398904.1 hypothetical protein [Acidobacteriota bacterium]
MSNDNTQGSGPEKADPRAIFARARTVISQFQETMDGVNAALEDLHTGMSDLVALREVTKLAEDLLAGHLDSGVDIEARGELGKLLQAINKTRDNLAQLDQGVHAETGKMPQLASFLDDISLETEQATQEVLSRLDEMIQFSEQQSEELTKIDSSSQSRRDLDRDTCSKINDFLEKLHADPNITVQDALEHLALMGEEAKAHLRQSEALAEGVARSRELAENQLNSAFDIMNLLQFQDITRQKVAKVITLLKEMQDGLFHLLKLFNLEVHNDASLNAEKMAQSTQDNIFTRHAFGDGPSVDVDAIINNFQNSDSEQKKDS